MKTANYLDECKKTLELTSDYKLAKIWEIDDAQVSSYRSGRLKPDNYLCFRIAETLHKSPSEVIAELESENTKNEVKSLYFKRFFSTVGLWIILASGLQFYSPTNANAYEAGSRASVDLTPHYTKLKRLLRKLKMLINERYFTCNWTRKALRAS